MPTVYEILSGKGETVYSIEPDVSVLDAVSKMNRHKLGALVVMRGEKVVGMFTERDVLTRVVGEGRDPALTLVSAVMTRDVICVEPYAEMDEVAALMQQRRIRHVPICDENGKLHGLVSIGDINAHHASRQATHISFLSEYIYGRA